MTRRRRSPARARRPPTRPNCSRGPWCMRASTASSRGACTIPATRWTALPATPCCASSTPAACRSSRRCRRATWRASSSVMRVSVTSPAAAPDAEDAAQGRVLGPPIAVDPATGTAVVRMARRQGLAAGTPVQVEIVAEEHSNVIVVPAAAVVRKRASPRSSWWSKDGKAHRREVVPGIVTDKAPRSPRACAPARQVVVQRPGGPARRRRGDHEAEAEPEPAPQ